MTKTKLGDFWDGYCPKCALNGRKEKMRLNANDFFECEKSRLQIVLTFPNFFASILKFRGSGEWRSKPDYAHELPRNEMLCKQISDNVPTLDSKLNVDYTQFKNSDEIEKYIEKEVEKGNEVESEINDNEDKLSKGITGIAGEYFVAGELSRRGFMASITLRNNDSVDIHASRLSNNKIFAIQVKTNQSGSRSWVLTKKAESIKGENLFYVFVSLRDKLARAEYFIVPSTIVADTLKREHAEWLVRKGKKGQAHKDSDLRKFHDEEGKYLERWNLLS